MESVARTVLNQPINLEEQVKSYKDFWNLRGIDPKTQERIGEDHSNGF